MCVCISPRKGGNVLLKLADSINSTGDLLQVGEAPDVGQLAVVGDRQTAVDGGQPREGDVVEIPVVVQAEVTALGQVRRPNGLLVDSNESQLAGQRLEGRDLDIAGVAEGHVLALGQVGQVNLELGRVGRNVEQTGRVLQVVHIDLLQRLVGGNIEVTHGLQLNAVEVDQTGVGDANATRVRHALGELQALQFRQGGELDRADGGELIEGQRGQAQETLQLEGVTNAAQLGGGDGRDVGGAARDQATLDLLDRAESEITGSFLMETNIALNGAAAPELIRISLGLDGDGLIGAVALWKRRSAVCLPRQIHRQTPTYWMRRGPGRWPARPARDIWRRPSRRQPTMVRIWWNAAKPLVRDGKAKQFTGDDQNKRACGIPPRWLCCCARIPQRGVFPRHPLDAMHAARSAPGNRAFQFQRQTGTYRMMRGAKCWG